MTIMKILKVVKIAVIFIVIVTATNGQTIDLIIILLSLWVKHCRQVFFGEDRHNHELPGQQHTAEIGRAHV